MAAPLGNRRILGRSSSAGNAIDANVRITAYIVKTEDNLAFVIGGVLSKVTHNIYLGRIARENEIAIEFLLYLLIGPVEIVFGEFPAAVRNSLVG